MTDRSPDAPSAHGQRAIFTSAGIRRGIIEHLPLLVFGAAFGFAFGAAAVAQGMPVWIAGTMSAATFAGASQFAVLDLWRHPLPYVTIALATLAVNARHLILGAAIAPWLSAIPPLKRYAAALVLSDANFAKTLEAKERGERDVGYLVGGGLVLWFTWVSSTIAGASIGAALGDLGRFGLDVVMIAFFAATILGLWKGKRDLAPWLTAAIVSVAGSFILPVGWHIIAGALAGGVMGAWRHGR